MTDIDADSALPSRVPPAAQAALRKKIGWLCQFIRFMALGWALWVLYFVVTFWGDRERVVGAYARGVKIDISGLPDLNYYAAFSLVLLDWAIVLAMVGAIWRLCSCYLAGRIFTVEASLWLRRVALLGGLALLIGIFSRPAIFSLLTTGHGAGDRHGWFFQPADLLDAIFVTFLFSLAHIFKTAAELADEHEQIV